MERQHIVPLNDLRGHVTDGPCPCIPWSDDEIVIHNSYDKREVGEVCAKAFRLLGCALAGHNHTWTSEERTFFERAYQLLEMHWSVPGKNL